VGWLQLVGSISLQVSFAKEPCKRDYILQKGPVILRSLLIVANPYQTHIHYHFLTHTYTITSSHTHTLPLPHAHIHYHFFTHYNFFPHTHYIFGTAAVPKRYCMCACACACACVRVYVCVCVCVCVCVVFNDCLRHIDTDGRNSKSTRILS